MRRMRLVCMAGAVTIAVAAMGQTDLVISAFSGGMLTWTNVNSNLYYSVEWRPSLTGMHDWTSSFRGCQDLRSTNGTLTVPVPMFYRVVGTSVPAHTRVLSPHTTVMEAGYYEAGDLLEMEPDLLPDNVRAGMTIFGVAGKPEVVDTSSGDATAGEIAAGKKAWVAGTEITGTADIPAYPAPVPKTGQTASYAPGDDGDLRPGVASPTPRFTLDIKRGTVIDNLTGLMWAKDANISGGSPQWAYAVDYCDSLSLGGHDDWRLPTVKEMVSLCDFGRFDPALPPGHPFINVRSTFYWTSTTHAADTNKAHAVYLGNGESTTIEKTRNWSMWPVRGGD